jgi:DNA-binding transcriptional LysR family regulator
MLYGTVHIFRGGPSKIAKMELYQLRTFAAVGERGSLTQAAEQLHLSQPAASAQIKLLEDEFGVALFERRSSGLTLTCAGAALLPEIQRLLADANRVMTHAKSLSGQVKGPFRFAVAPTVFEKSVLAVGRLMCLLMARHPELNIEMQQRTSRNIVAGVTAGELDAGLALGRVDLPNIRRIPLQVLRYRIAAPPARPTGESGERSAARMRKASWKQLASAPWITSPAGGSHHQMTMQLFGRLGCQPARVIEADSEPVITSLIKAGVGLGLMHEDQAVEADRVGEVVLVEKGRPSTYLQLLHRTGRERDPAIRAILAALQESVSDENWLTRQATTAVSKRVARGRPTRASHFKGPRTAWDC